MKTRISVLVFTVLFSGFAALSQESVIGDSPAYSGCLSQDRNNAYCNKYANPSGLPSYTCQSTSIHNTACFDCIK